MYDDCHMLIRNSKLLGKWAKLIKLDGEIEYFCTWKVEKIHIYANLSMYVSLNRLYLKVCDFFVKFHVCSKHTLLSWIKKCREFTRLDHP